MNLQVDGPSNSRLGAAKTRAEAAIEFRIIRLPRLVADVNTAKIQITAPESDHRFISALVHAIDAAPFLWLVRVARVKHHPVAGLEWGGELDRNFGALDAADLPKIHAALFAEAGMDQFLIVVPAKPAGVEAARKRHLQLIAR